MQRIALAFVPWVAGVLYAQPAIESKSITLTVTKAVAIQTADLQVSVNILGDLDTTMDQVLAAVKDVGLTAQDLAGLSTAPLGPRPDQFRLNYSFRLVVPFSRMKQTLDALDRLRRTIDTNLELQYYTVAAGASATAFDEARQRALNDLVQSGAAQSAIAGRRGAPETRPVAAVSDSSASAGYPGSPSSRPTSPSPSASPPSPCRKWPRRSLLGLDLVACRDDFMRATSGSLVGQALGLRRPLRATRAGGGLEPRRSWSCPTTLPWFLRDSEPASRLICREAATRFTMKR